MIQNKTLRVMWLLNHDTAREFEISMLKRIGVSEVFLPKIIPIKPGFRSSSIDWSEDKNLTIPASDLRILNDTNWYENPSPESWMIANKYFDLVFMILLGTAPLESAARFFSGAVIWRCYGLGQGMTYHHNLQHITNFRPLYHSFQELGRRFFFGEAYSNLADKEPAYLKSRRCFLPAGFQNTTITDKWEGTKAKIFFVCPEITYNPYYSKVYRSFIDNFRDFPYSIAGYQPTLTNDPNVLTYGTAKSHQDNMRQYRVMFYHSQEAAHIHYHPFEAIRVGMPLIFMSGGLLDKMGGKKLPGRCETFAEARKKIRLVLDEKSSFAEKVRSSQHVLLTSMSAENLAPAWHAALEEITEELSLYRQALDSRPRKATRKRIAVILPQAYRGGTLRGAKLIAEALHTGSRKNDQAAEVVLFHLRTEEYQTEDHFNDLPAGIIVRPFEWKTLGAAEARRAMRYSGFGFWEPTSDNYIVPDDGIAQLQDCDLHLYISDRLDSPILPHKPYILVVYDYLQRYERIMNQGIDMPFIDAARKAARVFVTTDFTYHDTIQYAGLEPERVRKLPMLAPGFSAESHDDKVDPSRHYFIWTTNSAPHKNHKNAIEALRIYYEEFDGQLDCWVTGVNTKNLLQSKLSHISSASFIFSQNKVLQQRIKWKGELSDKKYQRALSNSRFLWHAGRLDNGTFCVIEAAHLGIPSLTSSYPAMMEIDDQFSLQMALMDPHIPRDMAKMLKSMERNSHDRKRLLPSKEKLKEQSVESLATTYWNQVWQCL